MTPPSLEDTISEARTVLTATADKLRDALSELNQYGELLDDMKLCYQRDGSAWGEVHDGLMLLMEVLYGESAAEIDEEMFNSGTSPSEAAAHIADKNAPLYGVPTDEVRDDLIKYRAWKRSVEDSILPPERVIGNYENLEPHEIKAKAIAWLDEQIADCLAALAYRNVPEVAP